MEILNNCQDYVTALIKEVRDITSEIADTLGEINTSKDDYVPIFNNGHKTGRRRAVQSSEARKSKRILIPGDTDLINWRSRRRSGIDQPRLRRRPRQCAAPQTTLMQRLPPSAVATNHDRQPPHFQCSDDFAKSLDSHQHPLGFPSSQPAAPTSPLYQYLPKETRQRHDAINNAAQIDELLERSWKWNELSDSFHPEGETYDEASLTVLRPQRWVWANFSTRHRINALGPIEQPAAATDKFLPLSLSSLPSTGDLYRSAMDWDSSDDEKGIADRLRASFGKMSLKKPRFALRKNL